MNREIYVNTPELREHLAVSREELRMADTLLSEIRRLKYFDLLSGDHRRREAEKDAQKTEELLSNVFGTISDFCGETEDLIGKNAADLTAAQNNALDALRHFR